MGKIPGLFANAFRAAAGLFREGQRPEREEPYYYWRCPGCGQKMRYLASRAGRTALCPRCGGRCTLPQTPLDIVRAEVPGPERAPRVGRVLRVARRAG